MFNDFEMEQKEKAFKYSKLRFEKMDSFLNKDSIKFRDEYTNYSFIFITIAKFISFKEDIWIKNKKTKNISTNFSREILDNYLFKGKLKSTKIDFQSERKRNSYKFTPIKISNILKGKENDSVWIIDNIRDSIAHGHYYIDFTDNKVIIKNLHQERLLECSLKFDLLVGLNELITEERIGGYTEKKLTTPPILHFLGSDPNQKPYSIKNEYMLKNFFKNNLLVSYNQVTNCLETDENKKYNDLVNFFNFNSRLIEEVFKKARGNNIVGYYFNNIKECYIKKINSYIEHNMKKYNITVFSDILDDETIESVIKYLREQPKFYKRNIEEQGLILQEILSHIISNEKITLERGITDLAELYTSCSLKQYITNGVKLYHLNNLIFSNVNSFTENKKLANLQILGLNNFVSNKETIYDKVFGDYNDFNINNFEYQDYSGYKRLLNKLKTSNEDLKNLNNSLKKANENKNNLIINLSKAPENKKQIISNNISKTDLLIKDLNIKIKDAINEINNINYQLSFAKSDSNGSYINIYNKNFFAHLRNALAHNHIRYADDRLVYNRKIILEDFDDNGELTFKCSCRYYDLVKLFNNELFLEALGKNKRLIKRI